MSPVLGRRMAHFNRRVTNRLTRPFARWLPGFGIVVHEGRRSKREYRAPVNVFRAPDGYVIALTYGTESQWVRNARVAGGCELITRGKAKAIAVARVRHDESRRLVPAAVRPVLRLLRVADFLHLTPDPSA